MTKDAYKVSIEAVLPQAIVEGKEFKVTYRIKNIGDKKIPKGTIVANVFYANIGFEFHSTHIIQIENLEPNDSIEEEKTEKAMTVGMTIFSSSAAPLSTSDGGEIHLYKVDGTRIVPNMIFGKNGGNSHWLKFKRAAKMLKPDLLWVREGIFDRKIFDPKTQKWSVGCNLDELKLNALIQNIEQVILAL